MKNIWVLISHSLGPPGIGGKSCKGVAFSSSAFAEVENFNFPPFYMQAYAF